MSAPAWCLWLENTGFAVALKESAYVFPIVEGTHLLGMSVSVGLILLLDLRLLRLAFRNEPVSRIMRQVAPWMTAGFALVFATGLALFAANATAAYGNWFFRLKLALVFVAGVNAAYYQVACFPKMAQWDWRRTYHAAHAPWQRFRSCAGRSSSPSAARWPTNCDGHDTPSHKRRERAVAREPRLRSSSFGEVSP